MANPHNVPYVNPYEIVPCHHQIRTLSRISLYEIDCIRFKLRNIINHDSFFYQNTLFITGVATVDGKIKLKELPPGSHIGEDGFNNERELKQFSEPLIRFLSKCFNIYRYASDSSNSSNTHTDAVMRLLIKQIVHVIKTVGDSFTDINWRDSFGIPEVEGSEYVRFVDSMYGYHRGSVDIFFEILSCKIK
jgi:hypothetical protein